MILYHGTPLTPAAELEAMAGLRFCVPFPRPDSIVRCNRIGVGMMLDNGAYTAWRAGKKANWTKYYRWAEKWLSTKVWAVIPDVIDGGEDENDALIANWPHGNHGAPVWHLHESFERLLRLIEAWPRVCVGSSGQYATVLSPAWQRRMDQTWNEIDRVFGRVPHMHMLRGLQLVERRWPFASADSTDVARTFKDMRTTARWRANRWEVRGPRTATTWTQVEPAQLELFSH